MYNFKIDEDTAEELVKEVLLWHLDDVKSLISSVEGQSPLTDLMKKDLEENRKLENALTEVIGYFSTQKDLINDVPPPDVPPSVLQHAGLVPPPVLAAFDFHDGNGPVSAQKHPNGGGWVAQTAIVENMVYVGPDAKVYGNARVYGNSRISGTAEVFGDTKITDGHFHGWQSDGPFGNIKGYMG
jgi:hypothetical protein